MTIAALKTLCSRIPWCEQAVLEPTVELRSKSPVKVAKGRHLPRRRFHSGWARSRLSSPRAVSFGSSIGARSQPRSFRNCGYSTATTPSWVVAAATSSLVA